MTAEAADVRLGNDARLTPEAVEDIAFALRQAAILKAERVQLFTDAAVLAAEQVQDKRLEFLEQGPEVTIEAALFEALVGFCLNSQILRTAASAVSKKIIGDVLASRTAFVLLPKSPAGQFTQRIVEENRRYGSVAEGAFAERFLRTTLRQEADAEVFRQYSDAVRRAAGSLSSGTALLTVLKS